MELRRSNSRDSKIRALPREPIAMQEKHNVNTVFCMIKGVAHDLEHLRKGLLVIIDVRNRDLESKVSVMQQEISNCHRSPGVHLLQSELK